MHFHAALRSVAFVLACLNRRPAPPSQLRAGGVLEAVRIACAGFPSRKAVQQFVRRYALLLSRDALGGQGLGRGCCEVRAARCCHPAVSATFAHVPDLMASHPTLQLVCRSRPAVRLTGIAFRRGRRLSWRVASWLRRASTAGS